MKLNVNKLILLVIFLLALFVRMYKLGDFPEAIDEDEMALGYYGYSLVNNATDEYGKRLPLYFESVGDYKYGLYSYFASLPIALFGLNALSTRMVAALAGALSSIAVYYLACEIFKNRRLALISAFVLALAPTHIHFSRVAYNNVFGGLFAILSYLFFLRWLKASNKKNLFLTFIFYLVAIFSYQAYRIFLPVVFLLTFIFLFKDLLKKGRAKKAMLVVITSFLIVFLSFLSPQSRARSQNFSLLVNQPRIVEAITEDYFSQMPIFLTRAFHNKPITFILGYLERYLAYFDPRFLFLEASKSGDRHAVPGVGLVYLIEGPLFLLGILNLFSLFKDRKKYLPLVLLFTSPLAASFVLEETSTTRAIMITYAYALIIAVGIYNLINFKKVGKFFAVLIFLAYLANFAYAAHQYLVHKIYHHPWYSDVGLKEMAGAINNKYYSTYSNFVMSGGHYISFLFYGQVDPKVFITKAEFLTERSEKGTRIKSYEKLIFNMPYECPLAGKVHVLYVCFGYKVPAKAKVIEVFRYRDGLPAIFLAEFSKGSESASLPERMKYSEDIDVRFPNGILPDKYPSFWPAQ